MKKMESSVFYFVSLINGEVREVTASMETEIVVKELSSAFSHKACSSFTKLFQLNQI